MRFTAIFSGIPTRQARRRSGGKMNYLSDGNFDEAVSRWWLIRKIGTSRVS